VQRQRPVWFSAFPPP